MSMSTATYSLLPVFTQCWSSTKHASFITIVSKIKLFSPVAHFAANYNHLFTHLPPSKSRSTNT